MKVILKEDIVNLGDIGNVVEVKNGYGRNYLIPRDLAVEANLKNLKKFGRGNCGDSSWYMHCQPRPVQKYKAPLNYGCTIPLSY